MKDSAALTEMFAGVRVSPPKWGSKEDLEHGG